MKEEFAAKLLVLGMILIMLSVTALAVEAQVPAAGLDDPAYAGQNLIYKNDAYYLITDDTVIYPVPGNAAVSSIPAGTVVVETVKNIEREINGAGQTSVTVTIKVEDDTVPVRVSEKAIEDLVSRVNEGEAVTIVAATAASVTVPANISAIIEKTGEPVAVGNKAAVITITEEISALFAKAKTVGVVSKTNEDGTIAVSLTVDGRTVRPEDIRGGLPVGIRVDFSASSVRNVSLVRADKSTAELEWKLAGGKLSVTLTESGAIRVSRK